MIKKLVHVSKCDIKICKEIIRLHNKVYIYKIKVMEMFKCSYLLMVFYLILTQCLGRL